MVFFFLFAPVSTSNYSIMNDHALPPKVVILSFMVVSAGCLISFFFVLASLVLLPIVFESSFPGVHEVMNLEKDQFNEALAADPHSVLPTSLFWCAFFIGILGSMISGFSVVRSAPFSRYGHVIFTATLVAVTWLQTLIAGKIPNEFRWMILISMFAMAGAILLGGKLGYREDKPLETKFIDEE